MSSVKTFILFLTLLISTSCKLWGQEEKELVLGEHPLFTALRTNQPITIDGKISEAVWRKTESRTLDYFYRVDEPTDQQVTTFRMLWDEQNLYVSFDCSDQFITARELERDAQPYFDDCAEIFLIPAPDSLPMHYGFELNLYKASNDFVHLNEIYQGQSGSVRGFDPNFEVEVTVHGTLNDNSDRDEGWTMEMAIPLKVFHGMHKFSPVQEGNRWAFLAVRQDRNDATGNRRSTSTIFPIYDINKNVHQRNRFGLLEFVTK
ncbi:MAG: carbohydrate-binding family 9-like protein [Saprospiraceae bacterium]|nr:carbohydrate-binding family 9-like protein [Saprospiraceae bacterium]